MTDMIATILNITPYAVIEQHFSSSDVDRKRNQNIATSSKSNPKTIIIVAIRFVTIP